MKNYSKVNVANDARTELHDVLSLTGAEVSVNNLPAGAGVPFVHSHKQNEEIYVVLSGKGKAVIDGETETLSQGDWVRVAPAAKRQFSAAEGSAVLPAFKSRQIRLRVTPQPTLLLNSKQAILCKALHMTFAVLWSALFLYVWSL